MPPLGGNHIIGLRDTSARKDGRARPRCANVSATVQRMIPRPAWLHALFFCLMLLPASAQRKESAGIAPPPPVALTVKIRREGKTEIPLKIHGRANEVLKFLIRTPPIHGKVSEPRKTEREAAVVVYEPPADLAIGTDKFLFSVQSSAGVSAPVEVGITIVDQPPLLEIPDAIEFGTVRAGTPVTRFLEITNRGGGLATGEVIVEAPWKIDGPIGYRLKTGELAIYKLIFTPTTGGTFEKVARFTSDPTHSTTLRGLAESAVAASPNPIVLRQEGSDPVRTGTVELTNQTDEPRTLQLKADARLQVPPQVSLPARAKVEVPIQSAPGDVQALETELRIEGQDLALSVPVKAAVVGPIVRAFPRAIVFENVAQGKVAAVQFELENVGGSTAEVTWSIAAPFRTAQNSTLLVAGEKRSFPLEIESKSAGRFRAWLQCKVGAQAFDVPVEAHVGAGAQASRRTATSQPSDSTIPGDPEAPAATLESPDAQNLPPAAPADWLEDAIRPVGVGVSEVTSTTATVKWPLALSTDPKFRVEARELYLAPGGDLAARWVPIGDQKIVQADGFHAATLRGLRPGMPWTVRVVPISAQGEPGERLFAARFSTPAKPTLQPRTFLLPTLAVALLGLVGWRLAIWLRQHRSF